MELYSARDLSQAVQQVIELAWDCTRQVHGQVVLQVIPLEATRLVLSAGGIACTGVGCQVQTLNRGLKALALQGQAKGVRFLAGRGGTDWGSIIQARLEEEKMSPPWEDTSNVRRSIYDQQLPYSWVQAQIHSVVEVLNAHLQAAALDEHTALATPLPVRHRRSL